MGYYINITQSSFRIRTADLPKIWDLLTDLMSDERLRANAHGGSWDGGGRGRSEWWYSWVNTENARRAIADRDLPRFFEEFGYELSVTHTSGGERDLNNPTADTEITHYFLDIRNGEAKIGDEEKLFAAIAPVVMDGSFIDVRGEDDSEWRWMWENGKFYSQDVISKEIVHGEPREIELNSNTEETV